MSRPERKKISTHSDNVGGGLFQAFAGLSPEGLPPGDALKESPSVAKERKPGRVVLRKETAHRGGKTVIIVDGFEPHHSEESIAQLGKQLRAHCGCGGARKERTLELQGDIASKIRDFLERKGFAVAGIR